MLHKNTTDSTVIYLFAGPSLGRHYHIVAKRSDVVLLPPVKRGDIENLFDLGTPKNIAIADGYFHHFPAVSHQEIRLVLNSGCNVWGVASMGAIRAFEMKALGMRGFGKVYRWFENNSEFTDDEVTLLHTPAPPYHTLSEPLIHFRFALADLKERGVIKKRDEILIIKKLKLLYFGDRTIDYFLESLANNASINDENLSSLRNEFDKFRIKTHDLLHFLETNIWKI